MTLVKQRDPRLDVFRGLCLVMIFINHVPGNVLEAFTNRNFGFSDAAEGFVFMSGVAAGLAYSLDFKDNSMRLWTGLARLWRRAWTLYQVHILTTFAAVAAAAAVALWMGNGEILFINAMKHLWYNPLETSVGLILMTHQFGYVNILPLYLVLLFVSPIAFYFAWRAPRTVLLVSIALWFSAAMWRINLPNFPMQGGWFFNPFSWQLIFVVGLLTGVYYKQGKRFVPVTWWLLLPAIFLLIVGVLTVQVPPFSKVFGQTMWLAKETFHLPWFITAFDKTFLSVPRLLHILALAYVLSAFGGVRWLTGTKAMAPFALLGRQALPVFALGSVLCIWLQGVGRVLGDNVWTDLMLVGGGLVAQFALAAARQYWPKPTTA